MLALGTHAPTRRKSAQAAVTSWRRVAVGVLLLVAGAVAAAGCAGPEYNSNAFVVHVVAPTCEHASAHEPLLVYEKSVGSWGKSSRTEWRSMQRLDGCGEPFEGYPWSGGVLQVWVSDFDWRRSEPVRVQLGHRIDGPDTWAIGDDDRWRIDFRHIFLGSIDIGAPGSSYVPPDAVDAALGHLQDRQDCEQRMQSCGVEWEHVDLFTFEALPAPVDSEPPPRLVVPPAP